MLDFALSLNRTIQTLVDHCLDRKTPVEYDYSTHCYSRPAVGFKINLRSQWQGGNNLGPEIVQTIYMVFTGNTSVFYCSPYDDNGNKEYWHIEDVPSERWINTSNHDSCWRSDGFSFLFNLRMQMCKLANSKVPPARINSEAELGFGCGWPVENFTAIFKSNVDDYGYVLIKLIPQEVENE